MIVRFCFRGVGFWGFWWCLAGLLGGLVLWATFIGLLRVILRVALSGLVV